MKKRTMLFVLVAVVIFIIVAVFVTKFVINKITKEITKREIARITQQEVSSITDEEISRITKERTEEITRQILGGEASDTQLKEVKCDRSPTSRQFANVPYYTGALIDAHLHMPFTFQAPLGTYEQADWPAPTLEVEVAAGDIICNFDKEKISSAFGFYVVPSLLKGQALQPIREIEQQYKGKIIPFLMPAHVSSLDLKPSEAEEILNSNKGLFKGFGELALYKGSLKGVAPDDSSLLEFYKIAGNHNLIVMIHPDYGQQNAIGQILKLNPNVKFLFHGHEMEPWLIDILDKYPNAYYTLDTALFGIPSEQIASLYGTEKEEFISELKANFDRILEENIGTWKPKIEKYPDKFLWGTDRAFTWHFDLEVGALLEEMSRSFIGQLNPDVQEKFAYKNAERLLQ